MTKSTPLISAIILIANIGFAQETPLQTIRPAQKQSVNSNSTPNSQPLNNGCLQTWHQPPLVLWDADLRTPITLGLENSFGLGNHPQVNPYAPQTITQTNKQNLGSSHGLNNEYADIWSQLEQYWSQDRRTEEKQYGLAGPSQPQTPGIGQTNADSPQSNQTLLPKPQFPLPSSLTQTAETPQTAPIITPAIAPSQLLADRSQQSNEITGQVVIDQHEPEQSFQEDAFPAPIQDNFHAEFFIQDESVADLNSVQRPADDQLIEIHSPATQLTESQEHRNRPAVVTSPVQQNLGPEEHSSRNEVDEADASLLIPATMLPKKSKQLVRRQTSKRNGVHRRTAGGTWWLFLLPLLWLPLLAWFAYRAFAGSRETAASRSENAVATETANRQSIASKPKSQSVDVAASSKEAKKANPQPNSNEQFETTQTSTGDSLELHSIQTTSNGTNLAENTPAAAAVGALGACCGIDPEEQQQLKIHQFANDDSHSQRSENNDASAQHEIKLAAASQQHTEVAISSDNGQQQAKSTTTDADRHVHDDLTTIAGITPAISQILNRSGIRTYGDLQSSSPDRLEKLLQTGGADFHQWSDLKSWTEQAGFAKRADWIGLSALQQNLEIQPASDIKLDEQIVHIEADVVDLSPDSADCDDLTKLNGIGPATARLLNNSGIRTFREIHGAKTDRLTSILQAGGPDFQIADPGNWSQQAGFAMTGDWDGLQRWQQSQPLKERQLSQASAASSSIAKTNDSNTAAQQSGSSSTSDDLTKIKGIGPATANLLQESGIRSFADLRAAKLDRIEQILDAGGSKFQLIDPASWAKQAGFACQNDWGGLLQWQNTQSGSAQPATSVSPNPQQAQSRQQEANSPSSKPAASNNGLADNLTIIHGIGPATQKLLNSQNVYSIKQISQLTGQQLIDIIARADKAFCPVEPQTWPAQAKDLLQNSDTESYLTDAELESNLLSEIRDLDISEVASDSANQVKPKRLQKN